MYKTVVCCYFLFFFRTLRFSSDMHIIGDTCSIKHFRTTVTYHYLTIRLLLVYQRLVCITNFYMLFLFSIPKTCKEYHIDLFHTILALHIFTSFYHYLRMSLFFFSMSLSHYLFTHSPSHRSESK